MTTHDDSADLLTMTIPGRIFGSKGFHAHEGCVFWADVGLSYRTIDYNSLNIKRIYIILYRS